MASVPLGLLSHVDHDRLAIEEIGRFIGTYFAYRHESRLSRPTRSGWLSANLPTIPRPLATSVEESLNVPSYAGFVASGTIASVTGEELVNRLDDADLFLLDVREPDEVAEWQIPGVHNIPLGFSKPDSSEVPRDQDIVVDLRQGPSSPAGCGVPGRSRGISSRVLDGGMGSWGSTYDHVAGEFAGATVIQIRRRGKGCLSYVVGAGERAVVIDPSRDLHQYLDVAGEHGWTITHVLDTHLHADHLSGARELSAATNASLWLNPADPFTFAYEPLSDGKSIELAPGVDLVVSSVSVPGHTEGSTMYQLGDRAIFTGDTLFLESVGRPDLADEAEGYAHHLFHSLHDRVLPLE